MLDMRWWLSNVAIPHGRPTMCRAWCWVLADRQGFTVQGVKASRKQENTEWSCTSFWLGPLQFSYLSEWQHDQSGSTVRNLGSALIPPSHSHPIIMRSYPLYPLTSWKFVYSLCLHCCHQGPNRLVKEPLNRPPTKLLLSPNLFSAF